PPAWGPALPRPPRPSLHSSAAAVSHRDSTETEGSRLTWISFTYSVARSSGLTFLPLGRWPASCAARAALRSSLISRFRSLVSVSFLFPPASLRQRPP